MARTDIHRPSAAEFDPEDYDCFDVFDLHPDARQGQARISAVRILQDRGYTSGGVYGMGQCSHCGAQLRYTALMTHEPTKTYLWVGEQCLTNRFESTTKAQFQQLRKAAALDRAAQRRKAAFLRLCDEHSALVWATYAHNIGVAGQAGETWAEVNGKGWAVTTLDSIARKVRQYGEMSPRQLDLTVKLVDELVTAEAETARKAAELAAQPPAQPVPAGKAVVEGEIVSTRWQDNPYGPGGCVKMLVLVDAGWKVWGTKPAALDDAGVGDRVRFTATVSPSDDDPSFGFFKRPTKAEMLAPVGV